MQTFDTRYNYSIVEMKDVKMGLLHYFTDKYLTKEVISNYIINLQFEEMSKCIHIDWYGFPAPIMQSFLKHHAHLIPVIRIKIIWFTQPF